MLSTTIYIGYKNTSSIHFSLPPVACITISHTLSVHIKVTIHFFFVHTKVAANNMSSSSSTYHFNRKLSKSSFYIQ